MTAAGGGRGGAKCAAKTADIKPVNRASILGAFRAGGALSVRDVSRISGISRLTVARVIAELRAAGLLRSAGKGESGGAGGPRPELFEFSSPARSLCVSMGGGMGGGKLSAALCDMQNNALAKTALDFPADISVDEFLALLDDAWNKLRKNANAEKAGKSGKAEKVDKKNIHCVILACDGLVDNKKNILLHRAKSVHWGRNIPLDHYLQKKFPASVIMLESAARLCGISEIIKNDEIIRGKRVITISTDAGISSCFIDNRNAGAPPAVEVGELGHIMVSQTDTEKCGCGSYGCLEIMTGARRLAKLFNQKKAARNSSNSSALKNNFDIPDLFDAANSGDVIARELVDYTARMFFYAIRNLLTLLWADVLVFQGVYAFAGNYFFEKLRGNLLQEPFQLRQEMPEIICDTRSLFDIELIAASHIASNNYFDNLYGGQNT